MTGKGGHDLRVPTATKRSWFYLAGIVMIAGIGVWMAVGTLLGTPPERWHLWLCAFVRTRIIYRFETGRKRDPKTR